MPLKLDKDIEITEEFRKIFSRPPELLITKESQIEFFSSKTLITVGDVVTATAIKFNISPKLSIVDNRTKRGEYSNELPNKWDRILNIKNPPGKITVQLWNAVEESLKSKGKTLIIVDGEEDLASIPSIYLSPDGAIVIYGVPDMGIAVYEVGDTIRSIVQSAIDKLIGDNR